MLDAIIWGLIVGLITAAIMFLLAPYVRRRQAKNPHGECAYCGTTLAMMGPYAKVCAKCKRTQPWVNGGDPQ